MKASYGAIVACLHHIYTDFHEPEAFGLMKILCKKSTVAAIYLLDYVLPQLAKLSRALQTESLDLSVVSHLVDATLSSLNDALLPAANWVLELKEDIDKIGLEIETEITSTGHIYLSTQYMRTICFIF